MEEYIIKDGKRLRLGYTTGSCAAAAAKAACFMLLTGRRKETVELLTPKGILLTLSVLEITQGPDFFPAPSEKTAATTRTPREIRSFSQASGKRTPRRFHRRRRRRRQSHKARAGPARGRRCHQLGAPAHDRRKRLRGLQALRLPRRHYGHHFRPRRSASCPKDVQSPPLALPAAFPFLGQAASSSP